MVSTHKSRDTVSPTQKFADEEERYTAVRGSRLVKCKANHVLVFDALVNIHVCRTFTISCLCPSILFASRASFWPPTVSAALRRIVAPDIDPLYQLIE